MFEQYPDILTVEEVCEALRMGYNAVYDLLNDGKLKSLQKRACVADHQTGSDPVRIRKLQIMSKAPRA